jgi:hypothetical protein
MCKNMNDIPLITRREIEARIVGPLLERFSQELGSEKAEQIIHKVIAELSRAHGQELAKAAGSNTINDFAKSLEAFGKGGANEMQILVLDDERFEFNMTKCKYADLYKAIGNPRLGVILSCTCDFSLCHGFNPRIKLTRTQTIMEGGAYCDFRFRLDTG